MIIRQKLTNIKLKCVEMWTTSRKLCKRLNQMVYYYICMLRCAKKPPCGRKTVHRGCTQRVGHPKLLYRKRIRAETSPRKQQEDYYIPSDFLWVLYHESIGLSCLNLRHSKIALYYRKIRISPEDLLDEISRN